jgi:hypothetical protein
MALTKILPADLTGKGVVGLPDTPGLSTTEMQEKFDEIANDVLVPKHNALVDDLEATTGAGYIGALNSGGTASNVQAELDNRYTISVIEQLLANKVDTEEGKGLTSNDFTDGFKFKLNGIEDNANNYVLPKGSQTSLGGVMGDGTTFTIDENGIGHAVGGGGGGTADYNALINKPVINGVTVSGNKDSEEYGLLRPYIVVTSEAGSTITISKGGETITGTQLTTTTWGVCPTSYGTWTVSSDLPGADIATSTITIDAVKTYAITVNHITATIAVTYESGAVCTCSKGSTVYTATSNPQTFTVRSIGNWVISVDYDGLTKTQTVPITADGQSESVTVEFADIEVTYGNAFRGTTITCSCGDVVYSKTAPSNANTVSFTIPSTGTWRVSGTVSGDTYNQDVVVSAMTSYSATLQVFNATVTVTFPYTEGASCTLSDGVTTLTATTSPMAFSVPNVGTWTATCTLDSQAKTDSVTITTDGQTESLTFSYGSINLTYDNEFRGLSITCTDSNSTITKTAPISGNSMAFYPPNTGTWTISGVYSSVTYSTTVTVSSLSTAVTAQLILIPNGSTVTPTDDIQKWLNCAGIFDKTTYSSLSDILGDSVTFNALLGDSNACKYMARSTTWASTLCADQYAMTMIGQYDVCCDALLGNSTWASAIIASAYADYVITAKVPTMTSATAPSGEVVGNNYYDNNKYLGYWAFDASDVSFYSPKNNSATNEYIGYIFPSNVSISVITMYVCCGETSTTYPFTVQTYDGANWTDADTWTVTPPLGTQSGDNIGSGAVTLTHNGSYSNIRGIRLIAKDFSLSIPGTQYIMLGRLQFYGRVSQTDKIHGANNEVAYYLDGATQVPISNPSTLDAGTYTFGSTIAKNPDSLSSDYTKSIRITPNTVEVVLRPDNALYWWGYVGGNCESISNDNGWSGTFNAPTYNTNNVYCYANNNMSGGGIGTKNKVSGASTLHFIGLGTFSGNYGGNISYASTKAIEQSTKQNVETTLAHTTLSIPAGSYYFTADSQVNSSSRSITVSALWYE